MKKIEIEYDELFKLKEITEEAKREIEIPYQEKKEGLIKKISNDFEKNLKEIDMNGFSIKDYDVLIDELNKNAQVIIKSMKNSKGKLIFDNEILRDIGIIWSPLKEYSGHIREFYEKYNITYIGF
ncbi:MAG: hypothetical protein WC812_02565 [Candidatus Pacearchaeota archaeon]|jgi:hypothetical protein